MRRVSAFLVTFSFALAASIGHSAAGRAAAPDITGIWQGKLMLPQPVRRVMKIERTPQGTLSTTIYSIDETDDPIPVTSTSVSGSTLKLMMNVNSGEWRDYHRTYTGAIAPDGSRITGTWSTPGIGVLQMNFERATPQTQWPIPPRPKSLFVTVAKNVKLEVVDWGGSGPPLIFLAGLGNSAHVFSGQGFARSFTGKYHVYGITRRGFGDSSTPPATVANYNADRLGDDVIAVIDALHLERPILIGHSIAGEELSSIGTRHPKKVSALVYLDAGYSYALYDENAGSLERYMLDANDVQRDLAQARSFDYRAHTAALARLLGSELPRLQSDLRLQQKFDAAVPPPPGAPPGASPGQDVANAIMAGMQKYTGPIDVPILAIFAAPHAGDAPHPTAAQSELQKLRGQDDLSQVAAFQQHLPGAKVIRIPNADHYVFISNRAKVLSDINAFLSALLPKA